MIVATTARRLGATVWSWRETEVLISRLNWLRDVAFAKDGRHALAIGGWSTLLSTADGGETVAQVTHRADSAVAMALDHMQTHDVVFVGHSHFSRSVLTRWIEQPLYEGIRFAMAAASIGVCGFEHGVRQITALGLTGHSNPHLPA